MPEIILLSGHGRKVIYWKSGEINPGRLRQYCIGGVPTLEVCARASEIAKQFIMSGRFPDDDKKFKKVEEEEFHEIKAHDLRLVGYFSGINMSEFVVFCSIVKNRDRYNRDELRTFRKRMEACQSERG